MGPIDYTLDVLNPIEGALRGYALGRQDIEQRQVMQEREQMMGLRAAQEARAQQQYEDQRAASARQRQQAEAMQSQLVNLREMAVAGTLTPEAVNQFALENASTFDEFRTAFQALSEPRRQADTKFALQLSTSLLRGNTDAALNMIDTRIAAAENAGTDQGAQEAQRLRAIRAQAEFDPVGFATGNLAILRSQDAIDSETMRAVLEASGQNVNVQSSQVIGGVAAVAQMRDGSVRVTDVRTGRVVTGDEAQALLDEGRAAEAESRRAREAGATAGRLETQAELAAAATGAEAAGRQGIEIGRQTFERIGPIRSNIANLDRAIQLVEEEGANTGAIARLLPNWSASSIELENLRNQLGLDVVGSVTFGALSESELNLALDTALPTGMSEAALADWLRRKRDAQEQLVENLTMQAQFLSVPGRTLDQWIEFTQSGGATRADMRRWMSDNPVGRRPAAPTRPETPAPSAAVTDDFNFVQRIQAKIDNGEPLTAEEIARLNRIAAGTGE